MRTAAMIVAACVCGLVAAAQAGNASLPTGEPVLELPTLQSLGCYWIVKGDDNKNARVDVDYRKAGTTEWKKAMPLFRVDKASDQPAFKANKHQPPVSVPEDSWMFAGSIVLLTPDTEYEIKLKLTDPDGGAAEKTLKSRTIAEPVIARNAPTYHVVPGSGGGDGSAGNPLKGLDAAVKKAKPGDVFLVHKGAYGPVQITCSGQAGKPIVFLGAGDGEAVIEGKGDGAGVRAENVQYVWLEKLTIRKVGVGVSAPESSYMVVRRCHIHQVDYGIKFNVNNSGDVRGWFVTDNTVEGPCTWPRTKGIENPRGMEYGGQGHVIAYNRVRGFADALDTYPTKVNAAIDVHNNDVSELTDDGFEMDYSDRNTRCFNNRVTNAFQGISVQPVFGGPIYIFRNVLYNVGLEPFKMHSSPSGALMIHNTVVKDGDPLLLLTPTEVRNCFYRNNLFVGRNPSWAYNCDNPPMTNCDMDYDGFAGGPFKEFLKFNRKTYRTLGEVQKSAPVYRHATVIDGDAIFAGGVRAPDDIKKQYDTKVNDLRLKAGTSAIDAGEVLPNFSDAFTGKAPDLGACEQGAELPQYGPRPEKKP